LNTFSLSPAAWLDLDSIWQYIASDSVHYADSVEEAIFETCRFAAGMPSLGHSRLGIRNPKILFLAVSGYERYSIAYLSNSEPLRVLRILHGARDVPRLFR
jgi:plasmid stabilization system protein ParE